MCSCYGARVLSLSMVLFSVEFFSFYPFILLVLACRLSCPFLCTPGRPVWNVPHSVALQLTTLSPKVTSPYLYVVAAPPENQATRAPGLTSCTRARAPSTPSPLPSSPVSTHTHNLPEERTHVFLSFSYRIVEFEYFQLLMLISLFVYSGVSRGSRHLWHNTITRTLDEERQYSKVNILQRVVALLKSICC